MWCSMLERAAWFWILTPHLCPTSLSRSSTFNLSLPICKMEMILKDVVMLQKIKMLGCECWIDLNGEGCGMVDHQPLACPESKAQKARSGWMFLFLIPSWSLAGFFFFSLSGSPTVLEWYTWVKPKQVLKFEVTGYPRQDAEERRERISILGIWECESQ